MSFYKCNICTVEHVVSIIWNRKNSIILTLNYNWLKKVIHFVYLFVHIFLWGYFPYLFVEPEDTWESLLPVGNLAHGFAWGYYYGYLKIILPGLYASSHNIHVWRYTVFVHNLYGLTSPFYPPPLPKFLNKNILQLYIWRKENVQLLISYCTTCINTYFRGNIHVICFVFL